MFIYLYYLRHINIFSRCHAVGSQSEITAACLVSLMSKIFNEKSFTMNFLQSADNEQSCKEWFLTANSCLCDIKTKTRLKPKQLFLGK